MPEFRIKFDGFEHESVQLITDDAGLILEMNFDHAPQSWSNYQKELTKNQVRTGNERHRKS